MTSLGSPVICLSKIGLGEIGSNFIFYMRFTVLVSTDCLTTVSGVTTIMQSYVGFTDGGLEVICFGKIAYGWLSALVYSVKFMHYLDD